MDLGEQRSLAETPTWSVATVTTVMVAVCFVVERSIYWFGKWLRKTRRKAVLASLEKIKEELMLLGLISLMLGQCARWISEICVESSLFSSQFYPCLEDDFASTNNILGTGSDSSNRTTIPQRQPGPSPHHCSKGHEPFVSYESLKQLHRFLFLLGITHVLYSCITVVLSMIKIYSWRKWENQANPLSDEYLQVRRNMFMKRQSTFVFHHTSHPWSKNKILIWMNHKLPLSYNFHKYMVRSMEDEFHKIVGISWPLWIYAILCIFVNVHGLNVYFWLSFIPAILVMLVGTKLQHVVAQLALEIVEATGPFAGSQLKPRDDLFWSRKPELLLWLIQFISFQNAFETATFIWALWRIEVQSCFMKNHLMVSIRLVSGILIQFWCSYSTVPLNVIVTQMGSKFKKALIAESVRDSLHSWCKRVKDISKRDGTTRSVCSLESTIDERDEIITVVSGTLSRCSSIATHRSFSLKQLDEVHIEPQAVYEISDQPEHDGSLQHPCMTSSSSQ
ncbi:MLO-like protein 4 [Magnolia sinica]|uniref:MLO-like protein 4 n=1 Tax=Magnolia sinica TaxID=86752 RepID=UPI00265AB8D3|nr:MLO-like protein 4 [Magnolia sinica]